MKKIIEIKNHDEFEKILNSNKNIMIADFYGPECKPCDQIDPILEKYSKRTGFIVLKINVNNNPKLTIKYKIRGLPTLLFFKDRKPISQISGYVDENVIEKFVSNLMEK